MVEQRLARGLSQQEPAELCNTTQSAIARLRKEELMLMLVMATAVPSALGGFLVGRWAVAVIAPAVWALYVLGLTQHLWGYGVGDGWQYGLIVGVAAAAVGAATGVHIRRVAYRRRDETLREGVS